MSRTPIGRPPEILLVEDNLDDARATIQALKGEDCRCRISLVRDGEEALSFSVGKAFLPRLPSRT